MFIFIYKRTENKGTTFKKKQMIKKNLLHYRQVSTSYCQSRCLKIALRLFRWWWQWAISSMQAQVTLITPRAQAAVCEQAQLFDVSTVFLNCCCPLQQHRPAAMQLRVMQECTLQHVTGSWRISSYLSTAASRREKATGLFTAIMRGRKGRKLWQGDTFIASALNGVALDCQQLQALQKSSSLAIICFMLV